MSRDPGLFGDGEGAPIGVSPGEGGEDQGELEAGFFGEVRERSTRRGRPPGARNRKTKDFERLYNALGFEDPLLMLGKLISSDPRDVGALAGMEAGDVLALQVRAAGELAPYLHGKKPTEIQITDERLPVLIVATDANQLAQAQQLLEERKALSIGAPLVEGEAKEINGLEGEE